MKSARQIILQLVIYLSFGLILLISCKKETLKSSDTELPDLEPSAGFTPDFPRSNGFISCFGMQYIEPNQKEHKGQVNATAVFNDPETYLYSRMDVYSSEPGLLENGNLNMGRVTLNNYALPWSKGTYSGTPQTLISFDTALVWKIPGVEGAQGFTDRFQSHFPIVNATKSASVTMHSSQGYTMVIADYFKNYDSVFLKTSYTTLVRMKAGTNYIKLGDYDVFQNHPYWQDSTLLTAELRAFKYYHSRHSGRSYQYLFATKVPLQLLMIKD